ncbi:hypothetical protein ACFXB3_10350 [Streptomyces sp. NPDC059447]|uniref:hypothetical protein n=1 Tax=Streptomyces sp. NPDC059447 TaxID=3346834 RepID=UPI0036C46C23
MTRTNPTIPGFHDDLPDCREAWPNDMQTGYCPQECAAQCRIRCAGAEDPTQCRTNCEKECMKECLFVPCCTREGRCEDDGLYMVRKSCRLDYWGGNLTSPWWAAGFCRE